MAVTQMQDLSQMDTKELLEYLNNKMFQDVCEGALSHAFGADWAVKLYDWAEEGISLDQDREKHQAYVDEVNHYGSRATAGKDAIDTTYGYFLVRYYFRTKSKFHWGPGINAGPGCLFERVKEIRNLLQHNPHESNTARYERYLLAYNRMKVLISEVTGAMPGYFQASQIGAAWNEILEAAREALYRRMGSEVQVHQVEAAAEARDTYGRELSEKVLLWLNTKIYKRYPKVYYGESVELFREMIRLYNPLEELPYDLDRCLDGSDGESFSDESLRTWLEGAEIPRARSQKSILELISQNWLQSSPEEDLSDLREAAKEAQKRRAARPLTQVQANAADAVMILLAVCYRFREQIYRERKLRQMDAALDVGRYAREILEADRKEREGMLPYVPLRWQIQHTSEKELAPGEEILERVDSPQVRLFGEAGSGKTTLLKRMVALQAGRIQEGESEQIPVYVELSRLKASAKPLEEAVAESLRVTPEEASLFLEEGRLILCLDGFNEMLDYTVKAQFAAGLNRLIAAHPEQEVILTDRTLRKNTPVLKNAAKVFFYPLEMEDIRAFLQAACTNEGTREALLALCEQKEGLMRSFDSPLRLEQLIREFEETGEVSSDSMQGYVRYLLEREATRKMDRNIEYVETFLQKLAVLILMDQDRQREGEPTIFLESSQEEGEVTLFTQDQAEEIFGRIAAVRSWTIPDSRQCLQLCVDMGLLAPYEEENRNYLGFAKEAYRDYFYYEALDCGADSRMERIYRWMLEDI